MTSRRGSPLRHNARLARGRRDGRSGRGRPPDSARKPKKEAALAANDDRGNDLQRKVDRRGLAQSALLSAIRGKRDYFAQVPRNRGEPKDMEINVRCATLPITDGRLLAGHGQRDVCAAALTVKDYSNSRELRNWHVVVIVATRHCQAVVIVRPMRGTSRLRASICVGCYVSVVAAIAGLRTAVHAARRAIIANTEIQRITAHGEQLRRHQQKCEDRPRHEDLGCKNSPFQATTPIMISDQFGAGNDKNQSVGDSGIVVILSPLGGVERQHALAADENLASSSPCLPV